MKFYVEPVSKCTQRLGTLTEIEAKPLVSIKTPAVMLHTQVQNLVRYDYILKSDVIETGRTNSTHHPRSLQACQ
jgi:hypothetical protein